MFCAYRSPRARKHNEHTHTQMVHVVRARALHVLCQPKMTTAIKMAYNLNFSFHLGDNVCGRMVVARINFAGTGPLSESRCSRRPQSLRLKLNRKLWCLRNLSPPWWGESKLLSNPTSLSVRGVSGGGNGDTGVPVGCMPSIQYGSLKPIHEITNELTKKYCIK